MNLDYVAYGVLAVVYVFGVIPCIGSEIGDKFSNYSEDMKLGLALHVALLLFLVVLSSILWAVFRVFY
jgi:hypothetical protein